ncbi:cyclase family protein [Flavobacteriaceae bacterium S0825]|uniref:cyclase family protein n=1 Tax=Gaetbulibacter sp. S0825 TaxID=2720084 RepID=UPI0014307B71|nr:cyclase family protein [Gaetbulibacter sp. S0825]MCK0107833.1 cyclase family protein [Flavobacteriaceae bacterium S0825]NIX63469.1 cyclase family protein [Gaetbulibacter sp. S0825]
MKAVINVNSRTYAIYIDKPLDISIPLRATKSNVNAWYIDEPIIEPVKMDDFIVSVEHGAPVNFNNIQFNPHAHGTHTECVGHITEKKYSINQCLKQFFFVAEVITVAPEKLGDDFVISAKQLRFAIGNKKREAVIIRTLPNTTEKLTQHYSNTNPPYLLEEAAVYLKSKGVKHLLIDLPSVDRERDDGELLAHNAFWNTDGKIRTEATITEFIFVPNNIEDGKYILNLQIAPFENDATPSKPVLYKLYE